MDGDGGSARSGTFVLEDLARDLGERFPNEEAEAMATFARRLFARGGMAYAAELGEEDRVALVASGFRFFARMSVPVRSRVWNPAFGVDGWDSPYTILETHLADRPFVVDTIREYLHKEGLAIRYFLHPILSADRDEAGALLRLGSDGGASGHRESFVHCAIDRVADDRLPALATGVAERIGDVALATDDFGAMIARVRAVRDELVEQAPRLPEDRRGEVDEVREFLDWLVQQGFVFLGARSYSLIREDGRLALEVDHGSGLGIQRKEDRSTYARRRWLDEVPAGAADRITRGPLLLITRTTAESTVHRRARMDYVGVKRLDDAGQIVGEHRFLGLFTSKAYSEEPAKMPILRGKLRDVLAAEGAIEASHDYKEIVSIFNSIPKTELLTLSVDELRADIRKIQATQRTEDVHVTLRPDALGRGLTVMIIVPRERFSGEMRREVQELLEKRIGGSVIDYQLALGEGDQARLHFYLATPDTVPMVRSVDLENEIAEQVRSWDDRLRERLLAQFRGPRGRELAARYADVFTEEYKASTDVASALVDIRHLEALADRGTQVDLANPVGGDAERFTTLKIYLPGESLVLSDFLPILENFGLRVFAEDHVRLEREEEEIHLHRFRVQDRNGERLDVRRCLPLLGPALLAVRDGRADSDPLNRLVVEGGLSWREVDVLRTYRNLAFQTGSAPSREALTEVLAGHPEAARALFELFAARFDPDEKNRDARAAAARDRLAAALERVHTSGEDRMLRNFFTLVEATLRTNWYRPVRDEHPYVSIKIHSAKIEFLPRPRPMFEIYVHSARIEGVHLRGGKVARGGLRFSDRHDDFRTEILGLMKTQMVKNSVIVPVGSKGGFIVKRPRAAGEEAAREVRECYATLIRGLLDLTDNYVADRVVPPDRVVRHDEDDPYLVVAADKGTATFSDLANSVSLEAGFWLGDAFASGGSAGYDHKKEGITARGAWECVRHHFRELGKDVQEEPFTVVAIGDMSGDVFGNGMLLSRQIRLLGAFNHQHVFLDPNPDPAASWAERSRLFRLPRSSWTDYERGVMSPGGMIVPRVSKAVPLTPEVREMLGVEAEKLDGEGLVRALLQLETELLFNGGIGTYVRASTESDVEVGDPVNDHVRIGAPQLRARVVAEGGNLGLTQRARVEHSVRGGRINTDAIDNSGGVDLSDHEVNLKILFQPLVDSGELSLVQRNRLLERIKDEVIAHVLGHNSRQSLLISLDQERSRARLVEFRDQMSDLEQEGLLDRALEFLPDRDTLRARRSTFLGLARPELAVLAAHSKMSLQRKLVASPWIEDPYLERWLFSYFPPAVSERFPDAIRKHRLRDEMIALELTNGVIDRMGAAFAHRMLRDTGTDVASAVAAWCVAVGLTEADRVFDSIAETKLAGDAMRELLLRWEVAIESATKCLVAAGAVGSIGERLERWRQPVAELADLEEKVMSAETLAEVQRLEGMGLQAGLARSLVGLSSLRSALEIVRIAEDGSADLIDAAFAYQRIGALVDFAGIERWLESIPGDDRWEKRAAEGLREDVSSARRQMTLEALNGPDGSVEQRLSAFAGVHETDLARVRSLGEDLRSARRVSLPGMIVVVRELRKLVGRG